MNLMEGLIKELARNRDILSIYEEIPAGSFGAAMIRQSIEAAETSIKDGDVVAMLVAYNNLESTQV